MFFFRKILEHFYRRFFNLAFTFFVLVVTASYTASLASILVQKKEAPGTYQNIDEAIGAKAKICLPDTIFETFEKIYSNGISAWCWFSGNCQSRRPEETGRQMQRKVGTPSTEPSSEPRGCPKEGVPEDKGRLGDKCKEKVAETFQNREIEAKGVCPKER